MANVALTLGLVALGVYGAYYAQQFLQAESHFELSRIEYKGAKHCDREELTVLIEEHCPRQLLSVDLSEVRALVEGDPWVRSAVVRRKLPDRLIIHLTEREPAAVAAIDNQLHVVDDEGVVLDTYSSEYGVLNRPIVKGLSSVARENSEQENAKRIRLYLDVVRDLDSTDQDYTEALSEIDVKNPEKVAVYPSDIPVIVYLGRDQFRKRFETYLSQKPFYFQLKEENRIIEYIDVSYEDKVIFHTPDENVTG